MREECLPKVNLYVLDRKRDRCWGDSENSPSPTLHAEYHKIVYLVLQITMPIEDSESQNF